MAVDCPLSGGVTATILGFALLGALGTPTSEAAGKTFSRGHGSPEVGTTCTATVDLALSSRHEACPSTPTQSRVGHHHLVSVSLLGVLTVLLPGTGSDEDYLQRAFAEPLRRVGAISAPVRPRPRDLVTGYLDALSEAAADRKIIVGGVSLGAVVAATWALTNPDRTIGVLAALPPWTGAPGAAPAAVSATYTAAELRRTGLAAVTAQLRRSSPGWLADELSRSWRRQWPDLPRAFDAAAACTAPTARELEHLRSPMGVVGAPDDLIHPVSVATEWARVAPRAALRNVRLDRFGPDPEVLGAACVEAFIAARAVKPPPV